ncbi:MAG: sigma-54-dependent Fis family transcriptional regulator [Myxococcales bacterium]|nr:sigma-54-dependent Fis family transcriptional regulator [Myxococcales bacterium]
MSAPTIMTGPAAPSGSRGSVLVVDDERSMRDFLRIYLTRSGYDVTTAADVTAARAAIAGREFDLVITDLQMPDGSGLEVLATARGRAAWTQVIVVTAFATHETAIAALKQGAYDYLTKPFKIDEIGVVVDRALEKRQLLRQNVELRETLSQRFRLDRMVGKSEPMQRVFDLLRKVAPARTTILLTGESGTGKEIVARALHHLASEPRSSGPFIAVNCGAIPDALLESELFGHVKGAFTGAASEKRGLFEEASGGTLLLDEIGELSGAMQVKLLRALQERKVKPVGANIEREVDVRMVAATHRDLEAEVERGGFRRDLFYRLNVVQIHLPPLHARREDIPLLVDHFLRKHAAALGHPVDGIEPAALRVLCDYDYPGNVRELENIIERAVTLESGAVITRASLPDLAPRRRAAPGVSAVTFPDEGIDLDAVIGEIERDLLQKALDRSGGVRKKAAKLLKITFRSLRYRLAKLGVDLGDDEEGGP